MRRGQSSRGRWRRPRSWSGHRRSSASSCCGACGPARLVCSSSSWRAWLPSSCSISRIGSRWSVDCPAGYPSRWSPISSGATSVRWRSGRSRWRWWRSPTPACSRVRTRRGAGSASTRIRSWSVSAWRTWPPGCHRGSPSVRARRVRRSPRVPVPAPSSRVWWLRPRSQCCSSWHPVRCARFRPPPSPPS
jgi:hypothetical protein